MSRRTHAAAGLLIGFGLGAHYAAPFEMSVILAFVGQAAAVAPDLDLKLGIRHRGFTHSLIALALIGMIAILQPEGFLQKEYFGLALFLSYASHLFLDLLTVQGIELFYPNHSRIKLMKLRTSSRIDYLIGASMLCGALYGLFLVLPLQILAWR